MLGHVGIILSMNNILYCLAYLNTLHTQWGNITSFHYVLTGYNFSQKELGAKSEGRLGEDLGSRLVVEFQPPWKNLLVKLGS